MKTLVKPRRRANCHRLIYRNWIAANEQFPVGRISLKRAYISVRGRPGWKLFQMRARRICGIEREWESERERRQGEYKIIYIKEFVIWTRSLKRRCSVGRHAAKSLFFIIIPIAIRRVKTKIITGGPAQYTRTEYVRRGRGGEEYLTNFFSFFQIPQHLYTYIFMYGTGRCRET